MVTGTLLICRTCGDCIEQLGAPPSAETIEAHRDDFCCDCGGELELAMPDPQDYQPISYLELRGG